MILMIDNYDSFTYNLAQYFYMLDQDVVVRRNDEIAVEEAIAMNPEFMVISPGPGRPSAAGIIIPLIKACAGKIPLLGICLGHQAIGEAFGGNIIHARSIMHGKVSEVFHDGKGLYKGLSSPLKAVRYHSLAIEEATIPACLEIAARTQDGEIMGVRHRQYLIEGIQYHPESILTPTGKRQLANFIEEAKSAKGN
jgi:anthranilate synthase/aminodeoxychorismate synthase-like glutamine amidotransferase